VVSCLVQGSCVILIGPIDGARHCEPEPAYLEELEDSGWTLHDSLDLRAEDQIAVYRRKQMT